MTTLEAPPRNGRVPTEVAEPPADPVGGPADSPRRADAPAARGPAILRLTRGAAVVITVVIALSSFVLSFAALFDLAKRSGRTVNLSNPRADFRRFASAIRQVACDV